MNLSPGWSHAYPRRPLRPRDGVVCLWRPGCGHLGRAPFTLGVENGARNGAGALWRHPAELYAARYPPSGHGPTLPPRQNVNVTALVTENTKGACV